MELENTLLMVFRLNVLLDPTRSAKKILKNIVHNVEEMKFDDLEVFEKVVKVIDFFYYKCA